MYREYKPIFMTIAMCLSSAYCDNRTVTQVQWTPRLTSIVSLAILLTLSYILTCVLIVIIARLCYDKRKMSQNSRRLKESVYVITHARNNQYEDESASESTIKSNHIYETLKHNTISSENRSMPVFKSPINYEDIDADGLTKFVKPARALESITEQDQVESNYTTCIEVIA